MAYRLQAIRDTAVERDYYRYTGPDGKEHDDVEHFLGEIEDKAGPILKKLNEGSHITPVDKEILSTFIGYMMVRIPNYEKLVNEGAEKMAKLFMKLSNHSIDAVKQSFANFEKEKGRSPGLTPEQYFEFIQKGEYGLTFNKTFSLGTMMKMGIDVASYLVQMDWMVLQSLDNYSFITTDNPFTITGPPNPFSGGVGLITPGANKLFPIGSTTCLVMGAQGTQTVYSRPRKELARGINMLIALNSDRFVYGRDVALVERIVERSHIDKWCRVSRIHLSGFGH
jgi:hypothetical protein